MAMYFSYPTYSSTTKDLSAYEYDEGYTDRRDGLDSESDTDSDYEKEIEYSLEIQDKLERSNSGSSSNSGSRKSHSLSSSPKSNFQYEQTQLKSQRSHSSPPPIQIKSISQILDDIEKENQESKHRKAEFEKSHKLTSSQVEEIIKKETDTSKKRLPAVEEVYNRIKWDAALRDKQDSISILYQSDGGLVEAPFKSYDSAIPFHRVQMFKYKYSIIYSRKERLCNFDIVYNS